MSSELQSAYAGDVPPAQAWDMLSRAEPVALVDVRTRPEWSYVGVPDLAPLGRTVIFAEWQVYPTMAVDADFVARVAGELAGQGLAPDDPVLFLCRSGVRSQAAAVAMAAAGWTRAYNVVGGFEGPPDSERHRGRLSGWKAEGLPWTQS